MKNRHIRVALVIADDLERREFLSRSLGGHFPVVTVASSAAGLGLVGKITVDAVVFDIVPSVLSGEECALNNFTSNILIRELPLFLIVGEQAAAELSCRFCSPDEIRLCVARKVLVAESITASGLCRELEDAVGSNPPEYCIPPDMDLSASLPSARRLPASQRRGFGGRMSGFGRRFSGRVFGFGRRFSGNASVA